MPVPARCLPPGVVIAALLAVPAQAQSDAYAASHRSYPAADFARFAPRTALDMVRLVPGFVIQAERDERGLGQATGNLLLNGQRITGKSNDAETELSRIPAARVERIDVIDGATLNIAGLSGQVANVVVRDAGVSGQFKWRPDARPHNTRPNLTRFESSASGKLGALGWTLGLENQSYRGGADGPTEIRDGSGMVIEQRDERWHTVGSQPRASLALAYERAGGLKANLSLIGSIGREDYYERGIRVGGPGADRARGVDFHYDRTGYEIGGDVEWPLGRTRLKLIGLASSDDIFRQTDVLVAFADGATPQQDRFERGVDQAETVARAEWRGTLGRGQWQLSAEAAFNVFENRARLFGGAPGAMVEVPLAGADVRITEDRYEGAASYTRALTQGLTAQLTLGAERSTLVEAGPDGQSRSFTRPKGLLSLAWKASPRLDVTARLERRVGQLEFLDFAASVDLNNGQNSSGNPDLVPEQSWDAELELARQLGAAGNSTVRLYGRLVDDIVDIVPVGLDGEAPGNLDRATVFGFDWKTTLELGAMGWKGARLDGRLQMQRSRVDDPLTAEPREISGSLQHLVDVSLRHDVVGTDWAWGAGGSYERYAREVRLTETGRQWEGPVWARLFIEHKDLAGLTARATFANLFQARSYWDRTVYGGRRPLAPVAFVEDRDRRIGPIFEFELSGSF